MNFKIRRILNDKKAKRPQVVATNFPISTRSNLKAKRKRSV